MRVHARVMLVLSLVVVFGSPAFGATILLVSDCYAPTDPDPLHTDHRDDTLVAQLAAMGGGHTVDTIGMNMAFQGDKFWNVPANAAAIAAADLIVVSRRTSSGSYDKEAWNQIAKPLILMSGYLTRNSKWGWTSAESSNALATTTDMVIEAGQTGHAFFAGLTSPVTLFDWTVLRADTPPTAPGQAPKEVYIPDASTVDEGVLLATFDARGFMIDIPSGTDLGGAFGVTAARRAFLPTWGYDGTYPDGLGGSIDYKFRDFHTGDYDTVFENVVTELLIPEPATMSLLTLGGLAMLRRRRRRA